MQQGRHDYCFSHLTRDELAIHLSDEALTVLDGDDAYNFDGARLSVCVSLDATAGEKPA